MPQMQQVGARGQVKTRTRRGGDLPDLRDFSERLFNHRKVANLLDLFTVPPVAIFIFKPFDTVFID